jgi:putative ABC transport system permease protein
MRWSDVRLGLRLLVKRPWQTAVAILMLSLGIGLTTGMFSILYGTFLRGLPFKDPRSFVILDRSNPEADLPRAPVPYEDYTEWHRQQQSFADLVAWAGFSARVVADGIPAEHFNSASVSINLFDVIGVRPKIGRGFLPEDSLISSPRVVILSDRAWKEVWNGAPSILGRSIQVNGKASTVVGVMPPRFEFPLKQDLWVPLSSEFSEEKGKIPFLQVFGKLKKGVSLRQAQVEMDTIARRLAAERPETNAGFGVLLSSYTYGYTDEGLRRSQELLLTAVCAVLLLACINAASLLLVQSTQRMNELAVRAALGATRRRLMVQLLTEASILVLLGGGLGLLIARWAIDGYIRLFGESLLSFWADIRLDPMAFLVAAGACAFAVILAGLPVAFLSSGARPAEILKQGVRVGGGRIGRVYRVLCVAEIALSVTLLVVTGLTIKSILNLGRVDLGASPDKVLVGQLQLDDPQYNDLPAQVRFLTEIAGRTRELPGVLSAAIASSVPGGGGDASPFEIEGEPVARNAQPETRQVVVSPGYFEVFGLAPLEGRTLLESDREATEAVAVVNRSFAQRFFPSKSPVGRRLRLEPEDPESPWLTIVGVVPDVALGWIEDPEHDGVYLPMAQQGGRWTNLVIRTEQSPVSLAPAVRKAAAALDPGMVVFWLRSQADLISDQTLLFRSAAILFSFFGVLALFLAVVGLYGVMTLTVRQKARDIGIRMALGARPGQVQILIFRDGGLQVVLGVLLGLALASLSLRFVAGFLYNVEVWNPQIMTAASLLTATTGLLACLPPALQALRISPISMFKSD